MKLWCKEREEPEKMTNQDVSTLVDIYEQITVWRRNRRKKKTRLRVARLRKKLENASENCDVGALIKQEKIKKAAALNSAKYRKRKLEEIS